MADLNQLTTGLQPVTLAGQHFDCRLLKLHEWGALQGWLKRAVPSPIAEAARALEEVRTAGETVTAGVRKAILDHAHEAARLWPPRVGSIPWIQALNEVEGGTAEFIRAALRAAGHHIEPDAASQLERDASVDEVANLIRVCLHGEHPLPKSTPTPMEQGPVRPNTGSSPTTGESSSTGSTKPPGGPTPKSAS